MASAEQSCAETSLPLDIDDIHVILQVEQEQIQKRTFTNWMNAQLSKMCPPASVQDLFSDLRDGTRLLDLLEVVSGQPIRRERGHGVFQQRANIETALTFLKNKSIKLVNINIPDIIEGRPSIILGLIWTIILHCHIEELAGALSYGSRSSSLDSLSSIDSVSGSPVSSPVPGGGSPLHTRFRLSAKKTLLLWVRDQCQKVGCTATVKDFKSSWKSGELFLAILCSFRPELVDLSLIPSRSHQENLEMAFVLAEKELGIPRLLEPEDLDVKNPDEKSIMTYIAQFLQYSNELPIAEDDSEASANQKARDMTSWLQQVYQDLLEIWTSAEKKRYAEKYQAFHNFVSMYHEQRRPVIPMLGAMRRCGNPSEEQQSLRKAWDAIEEALQQCRAELDAALPASLNTLSQWLQKMETVLCEDSSDVEDHEQAAKMTRDKQEQLKGLMETLSQHLNTIHQYHNLDDDGCLQVPAEKLEDLKRRFTSVRVSAKYHGIKLQYREKRHHVHVLLKRLKLKLSLWSGPYNSQSSVVSVLQNWQDTVDKQGLLWMLKDALSDLKETAISYTNNASLAEDSPMVTRQVKEVETEMDVTIAAAEAVKVTLERVSAAWNTYKENLYMLKVWLLQEGQSQGHRNVPGCSSSSLCEWSSWQAQVNEAGNLLCEMSDAPTRQSLSEDLMRINKLWADFIKRTKFDVVSKHISMVQGVYSAQSVMQEASLLLREEVDVSSGSLHKFRKKLKAVIKKILELDPHALTPASDEEKNVQRVSLNPSEMCETLSCVRHEFGRLQRVTSLLEGRLAELENWNTEAQEICCHLKDTPWRSYRDAHLRAKTLISRGLQLEGQVVMEGEDLQALVALVQKNFPLPYLRTSVLQNRMKQDVSHCQEITEILSSHGLTRKRKCESLQPTAKGENTTEISGSYNDKSSIMKLEELPNQEFSSSKYLTLEHLTSLYNSHQSPTSAICHSQQAELKQAVVSKKHQLKTQDEVQLMSGGSINSINFEPSPLLHLPIKTSSLSCSVASTKVDIGSPPKWQNPASFLSSGHGVVARSHSFPPPSTSSNKQEAAAMPPDHGQTFPKIPIKCSKTVKSKSSSVHVPAQNEVYARAQAFAQSRLDKARRHLHEHIHDVITLMSDTSTSEKQEKKRPVEMRLLRPSVLETFLDAVRGMSSFCTDHQLGDVDLLTQSIRAQWEVGASADGRSACLKALRRINETLLDTENVLINTSKRQDGAQHHTDFNLNSEMRQNSKTSVKDAEAEQFEDQPVIDSKAIVSTKTVEIRGIPEETIIHSCKAQQGKILKPKVHSREDSIQTSETLPGFHSGMKTSMISDQLKELLEKPLSIRNFAITNSRNLHEALKRLDESIQKELSLHNEADESGCDAVTHIELQTRPILQPTLLNVGKSLAQQRRCVRRAEQTLMATENFLSQLQQINADITASRSTSPPPDSIQHRLQQAREQSVHLDQVLNDVGMRIDLDGGPSSCHEMVAALAFSAEDVRSSLVTRPISEKVREDLDQRERASRRKRTTLYVSLKEVLAGLDRHRLKEPTLPALQQRHRFLTDMENKLEALSSEIQDLRETSAQTSCADTDLVELQTLWERSHRTVTESHEQCDAVIQLLKKFQSCRIPLGRTLQKAEVMLGDQASYMGKENLHLLISKVSSVKSELGGLGDAVEEFRSVCRLLQSLMKKVPECPEAPFETEADALMDRWLDVTEKTDCHLDNLQTGFSRWEKLLQLAREVEAWIAQKMTTLAQTRPFQSEQDIFIMESEIKVQEENIERFHRKSSEVQEQLKCPEFPLELQVNESHLRKRMAEMKELFSQSIEVSNQMLAAKRQLTSTIEEQMCSIKAILDALGGLTMPGNLDVLATIQRLSDQLQTESEQSDDLSQQIDLLTSIEGPESIRALDEASARLQESIHKAKELVSAKKVHVMNSMSEDPHMVHNQETSQSNSSVEPSRELKTRDCLENPGEDGLAEDTRDERITAVQIQTESCLHDLHKIVSQGQDRYKKEGKDVVDHRVSVESLGSNMTFTEDHNSSLQGVESQIRQDALSEFNSIEKRESTHPENLKPSVPEERSEAAHSIPDSDKLHASPSQGCVCAPPLRPKSKKPVFTIILESSDSVKSEPHFAENASSVNFCTMAGDQHGVGMSSVSHLRSKSEEEELKSSQTKPSKKVFTIILDMKTSPPQSRPGSETFTQKPDIRYPENDSKNLKISESEKVAENVQPEIIKANRSRQASIRDGVVELCHQEVLMIENGLLDDPNTFQEAIDGKPDGRQPSSGFSTSSSKLQSLGAGLLQTQTLESVLKTTIVPQADGAVLTIDGVLKEKVDCFNPDLTAIFSSNEIQFIRTSGREKIEGSKTMLPLHVRAFTMKKATLAYCTRSTQSILRAINRVVGCKA